MYWFVLCVLFVLNSQMVLSTLLSAKCAVCSAEFTGCAKCAVCTEFTDCAKCTVCTDFTDYACCAVLCLVCRLLGYCGLYCAMRM